MVSPVRKFASLGFLREEPGVFPGFAIWKYGILSGTEMVSPVRKFASLGFLREEPGAFPDSAMGIHEAFRGFSRKIISFRRPGALR